MKIDELVSSINGLKGLKASKGITKDIIYIYPSTRNKYGYFLELDFGAGSWDEVVFDWCCLDGVRPNTLGKVLELVDEFLRTPIKERFLEKKYRLALLPDDSGYKNYLCVSNGLWRLSTQKYNDSFFTESDIEELKKCYPEKVDLIDAMKEPVEDE